MGMDKKKGGVARKKEGREERERKRELPCRSDILSLTFHLGLQWKGWIESWEPARERRGEGAPRQSLRDREEPATGQELASRP